MGLEGRGLEDRETGGGAKVTADSKKQQLVRGEGAPQLPVGCGSSKKALSLEATM